MLSVELPQCGIALQPRILLPLLERGPRVWGDGGCTQRPPPATAPTCGSSVPLQGQVLIRKLSVWKWEISRRRGGCCGTGKLRDESPCGNETTGMSPTFGQTPPAGAPILLLHPPGWHRTPGLRPPRACTSVLEQETQIHPKVTPNLPIPSVPHQCLRLSSPSGRKPPRSLRIGTQRHPDTAQCSEHPQEAPTSPKHPPASQKPQGPARSVAPSGTRAPPLHPEHPRGRAPLQQLPTRAHLC